MWSTVGDIDAGRGAKTTRAPSAPDILTDVDAVTEVLENANIAGSGIGTVIGFTGVEEGDVHLIAPEGTVNAGDAGVQVSGNITIAARFILSADNIQVGGKVMGIPKQESVPINLTAEGDKGKEASRVAEQASRQPRESQPSIIIVEVLGFGGGSGEEQPDSERPRSREKQSSNNNYDATSVIRLLGNGTFTVEETKQLTAVERNTLASQIVAPSAP